MKLSVVIPAYNEAATIREILRRVQATPYEKEIIVVDDGSTDGTRELLTQVTDAGVRVLFHERNQGKGSAVQTGFAAATGDYVIVQDADLEYDPHDYPALLAPLEAGDADVVCGSRFRGPTVRVNLFWHAIGNKLLTLLCNAFTDLNLSDMEGGLKAYRLDVVKRLRLESRGFEVEPEIIAKVARMGCRIYEVPIAYRGRSYAEGKKIGWRDGVKAITAILRHGLFAGRVVGPDETDSMHVSLVTMESLSNYNDWLWRQISPFVGRRVLEAGSGPGVMTRYLLNRLEVVAADIEPAYVARLRRKFGDRPNLRVVELDLSSSSWGGLERERFDTILCSNVLEHVADDAAVLRRFHEVLEPGGRAILLVPAHHWLYGAIDRAVGHYRRYDRDRLALQLRDAGFDVEAIRYLNPSGVVGWFVNSRLLGKTDVPHRQAKLYDTVFPFLSLAEGLNLPFGLSVLAVGRRPPT